MMAIRLPVHFGYKGSLGTISIWVKMFSSEELPSPMMAVCMVVVSEHLQTRQALAQVSLPHCVAP